MFAPTDLFNFEMFEKFPLDPDPAHGKSRGSPHQPPRARRVVSVKMPRTCRDGIESDKTRTGPGLSFIRLSNGDKLPEVGTKLGQLLAGNVVLVSFRAGSQDPVAKKELGIVRHRARATRNRSGTEGIPSHAEN